MRYLIVLLVSSFIVFAPVGSLAEQQHECQQKEFTAHDPVKDPLAFQNKDGFPTGPGCSVPEGFFKHIDSIKNSNPCASVVYTPCNPCSTKSDHVEAKKVEKT